MGQWEASISVCCILFLIRNFRVILKRNWLCLPGIGCLKVVAMMELMEPGAMVDDHEEGCALREEEAKTTTLGYL